MSQKRKSNSYGKQTGQKQRVIRAQQIPDHILNKQLLVERGQRESYILELEEENKDLKTRLSKYETVKQ